MSRSPRLERVGAATLAAFAAPVWLWATLASASPETPAPPAAEDAGPDAPAAAPVDGPRETPAAPSAEPTPDLPEAPAAAQPAEITAESPAASVTSAPAAAGSEAMLTARAVPAGSSASRRFGAMADVGLPDGATVSIVYRPIRAIRLHGGLSHNMISLGQRAGVTWVPLSWWASPTLSVEYGHYADGNANPLVRMVSGDTAFSSAVLDRVGYDYANAHVGLELGRKWFTFYVHAGVSRVTGTVHNLSAATMSESAGTTSISFTKDPSIQLVSVSARLGFIVYLAK
jgi:hypothetical protein